MKKYDWKCAHNSIIGEAQSEAIIIPSLNPDERFITYCEGLREVTKAPLILVDDGSTEEKGKLFFEISSRLKSDVVILKHAVNYGKGRALKTAFAYILENMPKIKGVCTCDSDGQHLREDVVNCMNVLSKNYEALVLGCRVFDLSHVPFKSRFGNESIRAFFKFATGRKFSDTQTGLRAFGRDFMRQLLEVSGDRFEFESKMLLVAPKEIVEVPIKTIYENNNKGTHFNPLVDSLKIIGVILAHCVKKFGIFSFVSFLSFLVDIGLFTLFMKLNPQGKGRLIIAVSLARVISMIFNYVLNAKLVFGAKSRSITNMTRYIFLALCIMGLSYIFTKFAIDKFANVNASYLKAVVDVILFWASYILQKIFVFSRLKNG